MCLAAEYILEASEIDRVAAQELGLVFEIANKTSYASLYAPRAEVFFYLLGVGERRTYVIHIAHKFIELLALQNFMIIVIEVVGNDLVAHLAVVYIKHGHIAVIPLFIVAPLYREEEVAHTVDYGCSVVIFGSLRTVGVHSYNCRCTEVYEMTVEVNLSGRGEGVMLVSSVEEYYGNLSALSGTANGSCHASDVVSCCASVIFLSIAGLVLGNSVNRYTGTVLFENMRSVRLVDVHSDAAVWIAVLLEKFHRIRKRFVTEIARVVVRKSEKTRAQSIYVSEVIIGAKKARSAL